MKARPSMAFEELSGKDGQVVAVRSRYGTVLRPRTTPKNPKSAAQTFVRGNLTKAAKAFKSFNSTQLANWTTFANTITRKDPVTGQSYHPTAINAFVELAAKFLQATPAGTIPLTPPATAFLGDDVVITTTAAAGKITFTASKGNAANVATEFLVQPLASPNVKSQPGAYRSKGFFSFVTGTLSQDVAVTAGYWAVGYRFVNKLTGQETAVFPLTTHQVTFAVEQGGAGNQKKAA